MALTKFIIAQTSESAHPVRHFPPNQSLQRFIPYYWAVLQTRAEMRGCGPAGVTAPCWGEDEAVRRDVHVGLLLALLWLVSACGGPARGASSETLRLGYMPNLTHAQAVLGVADGSLAEAAGVHIEPKLFASGPSAMTALFAGEIDALYVGPGPVINAYVRSGGKAVRVVAGAAAGGAGLVLQPGWAPGRLAGARLASPGVGNTQDIALRHWLDQHGLKAQERGGSVRLTPLAPPEIFSLFERGLLDGAWVPEPWVSRLVHEAGGWLAVDERDLWPDGGCSTTLLVVSAAYLERHPEAVRGLLKGHAAMTLWLQEHPEDAVLRLQAELSRLQGQSIPASLLADALSRVEFVVDPMEESVREQARRAFRLGMLGARQPDLQGLFERGMGQEVGR